MNIMLVSVTERTREIGLRMALGARERDVRRQFITEAVVLSLAGGAIGILAGIVASRTMANALGWPALVSVDTIAVATAFSTATGPGLRVLPSAAGILPRPDRGTAVRVAKAGGPRWDRTIDPLVKSQVLYH